MKDNNILSWICTGVTVMTSTLTHDVLQIILAVLGVLSALVSLGCNIYIWYKRASKDGKISEDELDELDHIINNTKGGKNDDTKR